MKKILIVNSLFVKQLGTGTKNFTILYVDVPLAENICLKFGQTSTSVLWILHRPYKMLGLGRTALIFFYWSALRIPEDFKLFKYWLMRFS